MSYSNQMAGYTKLFSRILDSTIWQEDSETRVLWITMLAMANRDGIVEATIPGLAVRARITLGECEAALEKFQQPDKYSWSQEEEGRRIKVVNGGWFLVNHSKYRELMSAEVQREKTRVRVQRLRGRRKNVTPVTGNALYDIPSPSPNAEAVSQKQTRSEHFAIPSLGEITAYCEKRGKGIDPEEFFNYYTARGWKYKGNVAMKNWRSAIITWEKNGNGTHQQSGGKVQRESRARQVARTNLESAASLGWIAPLDSPEQVEGDAPRRDEAVAGKAGRILDGNS